MNKMEHLKRIKQENEWRYYWLIWVEGDLTARMVAERDVLRDIYKAGYMAGREILNADEQD